MLDRRRGVDTAHVASEGGRARAAALALKRDSSIDDSHVAERVGLDAAGRTRPTAIRRRHVGLTALQRVSGAVHAAGDAVIAHLTDAPNASNPLSAHAGQGAAVDLAAATVLGVGAEVGASPVTPPGSAGAGGGVRRGRREVRAEGVPCRHVARGRILRGLDLGGRAVLRGSVGARVGRRIEGIRGRRVHRERTVDLHPSIRACVWEVQRFGRAARCNRYRAEKRHESVAHHITRCRC
jgi:hypothetical protein